jgi:hypothetical protein
LHEEAADKRDKPVHMFPSRLAKMGFWVVLSLRFPRKIEVARFNKGVFRFCLRQSPQPACNVPQTQMQKHIYPHSRLVVVVYRALPATTTTGKTKFCNPKKRKETEKATD